MQLTDYIINLVWAEREHLEEYFLSLSTHIEADINNHLGDKVDDLNEVGRF